jgi:hypothetical protein
MDGSGESKRGEAREFWEAALRLWSESGLSVRAFCQREGLRENAFYSWRRKQDVAGKSKDKDEKSEASSDRSREDVAAGFIELTTPMSAGVGYCMLELEKEGGAKMRVKLHGFTAADVAAIGRSFWRAES